MVIKSNIIKIISHAFLKRFGTSNIKRAIWNEEFNSGKWKYLDSNIEKSKNGDPVYYYIYKYCFEGNILDLGCGTGKTGIEIEIGRYKKYTGVDVSDVAIEQARFECQKIAEKINKNEFIVADISKFTPKKKYKVILFRESLYYIKRFNIRRVLDRYIPYLNDKGIFIVKICDMVKYAAIIRLIEKNYNIHERYIHHDKKMIILVFN
jgi:SAM-dependent methyltransferase